MSYLLEKSQEAFLTVPRFFLNPGAKPRPAIIGVTLYDILKRFKGEYQQSSNHLPFFQFFQKTMNIKERNTAEVALYTFFAQIMPSYPGSEIFNGFDEAMMQYTPFLLQHALRSVSLALERAYCPDHILFAFVDGDLERNMDQERVRKLLHLFQQNVLKSDEIDQFLVRLFLLHEIPQSVIDYEVGAFRAFMDGLFCDFHKRNLILRSMAEWPSYGNQQKLSFLQEFIEWHSSAFGISVPKVVEKETDAVAVYSVKGHQISVSSFDIENKHFVELMLYSLHENMYNYQMHLYRDFNLSSKQDPFLLSAFYNELSDLKEVRSYVKTLYLSSLNTYSEDCDSEFYYLQPSRFHAFTHEFFFATLFLEEFSKIDPSDILFVYQKIGALYYRRGEGYLENVQGLLNMSKQKAIYADGDMVQILENVMPRYFTFLEVYFAREGSDPSLRKAFDELERYGISYKNRLLEEGVIRERSLQGILK